MPFEPDPFDEFRLTPAEGLVLPDGAPVRLRKQLFLFFQMLLKKRGVVVSFADCKEKIWPHVKIDLNTREFTQKVNRIAYELNIKLGELGYEKSIKPAHGFGYYLDGAVLSRKKGAESHVSGLLEAASQDQLEIEDDPRYYTHHMPLLCARFGGRDEERSFITSAYEGHQIKIVCFYAKLGGEGKSQIIIDWLTQKQANGVSSPIFCFSFSDQESPGQERTTGGDFFRKAMEAFGIQGSVHLTFDKQADAVADAIRRAGAILCLDGIETLQEPVTGGESRRVIDKAVARLLAALSNPGRHFCLITSRYRIADLERHPNVQQRELGGLDPKAAVRLLRSYSLTGGNDEDLRHVAEEWGYHALSLSLLGSYLSEYAEGDLRRRDTLPPFHTSRASSSISYDARLMLQAHDTKLERTPEIQLLRVLCLLDRPEESHALRELVLKLTSPPIKGLTGRLKSLQPYEFNAVLKHLEDLNLISKTGSDASLKRYICHPLIRQHERECVKKSFRGAWGMAHKRLFDHFRKIPAKRTPDAPEDIRILYRATVHGCAAGEYIAAFQDVYWPRISRGEEHFSIDALGLLSEDLAATGNFFEYPWSVPAPGLTPELRAKILGLAGFRLRTLGRLNDATIAMEGALLGFEKLRQWECASEEANNLAVLLRMQGHLVDAVIQGEKALQYGKRCGNPQIRVRRMGTLGELFHYVGRFENAFALFQDAERIQAKSDPEHPRLRSTVAFRYCELLLTLSRLDEAKGVAESIPVLGTSRYAILNQGLAALCKGRIFVEAGKSNKRALLILGEDHLRHAYMLMKDSQHRDNQIRACVALAECLRLQARYSDALPFLDEADEIAEVTGMHLHSLDAILERLQVRMAEVSLHEIRPRLDALERRASEMGYELLRVRIQKLVQGSTDATKHLTDFMLSAGLNLSLAKVNEITQSHVAPYLFSSGSGSASPTMDPLVQHHLTGVHERPTAAISHESPKNKLTELERIASSELYYYKGGHVSAIRLFGAADEFIAPEDILLHYQHKPYPIPPDIRPYAQKRIKELKRRAEREDKIFFDGPCVRLLHWQASPPEKGPGATLERNIVKLFLGPVGWFQYEGTNGFVREELHPDAPGPYEYWIGLSKLINDFDVRHSRLSNIF